MVQNRKRHLTIRQFCTMEFPTPFLGEVELFLFEPGESAEEPALMELPQGGCLKVAALTRLPALRRLS